MKHTGVVLSDGIGLLRARLHFADDAAAVGAPGNVAFASAFARQQRVYERLALDLSAPLRGGDVSLQAFSDSKRLRFFDPSFGFDAHADGTSRGLALRATQQLGPLHLLTAGWDSRGDVALFDPGFSGGTANVARDAQTAWYLQDELHRPLAPLRATIGLRTEHITGTQSTTTPSLGILQRLSHGVDVSANYARAFRAPSLNERYYPSYGNANLQPEYGATFDLRVRAESGAGAASVSWFGSDTNNLIVNVAIDSFGDVAPHNVNRARVRGLEGTLQTRVGSRTIATLAYTDYLVAADLSPGHPPTRLQYRPSAIAALTLATHGPVWGYGGQELFVGRRFADEANTKHMPAYLMLGTYVQRSLGARTQVTLRADNLTNDRHAEDQLGYPVIGAQVALRLTVQY
ncbi:MAG: TonB-dependent receptor [Candidatus Eremiobacteraeota bacterium]|nr:TonB-dependent receptor [Candidatus Eremiobacteraeota bacterium]